MKEEIENKLEILKSYVNILRGFENIDYEMLKKDKIKRAAVERFFHLSIETVIDICSMIVSYENLEQPDKYREVIQRLGEEGILESKFTNEFADIAGFRNILVHQYSKVDVRELHYKLANRLGDFDKFAKQIAEYLV